MNNFKILISLLYIISSSLFVNAQEVKKDSANLKNDSINIILLKDFNIKLKEIEAQRTQDSIKKNELEAKLNSLKTTDNIKKETLLAQLEELKNQESKRLNEKRSRIDSLRSTAKSFPVYGFFDDTLFSIYSKLGSFSTQERAISISNRIQKIEEKYIIGIDSLVLINEESTVDIVLGDIIVMSVSENDAVWNNSTKLELAQKYKDIIENTIQTHIEETSVVTLSKKIGLAIGVLAFLTIVLIYINKLFKYLSKKIESLSGSTFTGIKIKDYNLLDASQQIKFIINSIKALKWIIMLIFIYIALPTIFNIFPWTQGYAHTLIGFLTTPLKKFAISIWQYIPNLFTIIIIILIFKYVIKGLHFLKSEIENEHLHLSGFYPDWANPTYQILKVVLYAFMFILIFPYLPGSDSPVFQGVSVFLGFLFTFGSAGSLSNVMAGLILTYMRLFKIGDRVKIGEVFGDVIEKSLLVTRVRTTKNEIISIPNSTVMNSHTINYSSDTVEKGLILHTTITLGYDVPWKLIHETLKQAADRTPLLLKTPIPFVLQTSLDDFYVSYQLNAYTKDANKQSIIYSDLHQNIQDCCNEAGIEVLSPHYRATRDGNMSTIPNEYLGKDYVAPSFNVSIKKDKE
jgi:small-conductance mechanosensitive channel